MLQNRSLKETFLEGSSYKLFLLSVLITGLSYGLYKGMLDNFLAEVVQMGEMGRGVTEFFRELPGIALIFILAAFYMLSAETLYKAGAVIMLVGMAMHAARGNKPEQVQLFTVLFCCVHGFEQFCVLEKFTVSNVFGDFG